MESLRRAARRLAVADDGQNMVEFALLLPVLVFMAMAIVQFGVVFNDYIQLNNAVREGARRASVHFYDLLLTKAQNDAARHLQLEDAILAARGSLNMGATRAAGTPNFAHTGTFSSCGSDCFADGDIKVWYTDDGGTCNKNKRDGCRMHVEIYYHEPIWLPFIDGFLPTDPSKGAGWFRVPARVVWSVH
jgi:hypothetical protein